VRVLAHVEWTVGALDAAPEVANRLRDRQNMGLRETVAQWRPAVSGGAESDHLVRIVQVWHTLEILTLQPRQVDPHLFRDGVSGEWRDRRLIF
jgi:hypothetical protein